MPYSPGMEAEARAAFERSCPSFDRSLEEHNYFFQVKLEELLQGRQALILGAGAADRLSSQLQDNGIHPVSVNPMWCKPLYREMYDVKGGRRVASIAQHLPFGDKAFDAVIGMYSVPRYLPRTARHYSHMITETIRVLSDGGVAMFGPLDGRIHAAAFLHNQLMQHAAPGQYHVAGPMAGKILLIARAPEVLTSEPVVSQIGRIDTMAAYLRAV